MQHVNICKPQHLKKKRNCKIWNRYEYIIIRRIIIIRRRRTIRDYNWIIWTVSCFNHYGIDEACWCSWWTKTAWAAWVMEPSMPMQLLEASNWDTKSEDALFSLSWWIFIQLCSIIRLVWPRIEYSSKSYSFRKYCSYQNDPTWK